MILYVNGDSHSVGHDAVDPGPNPENSYGKFLADYLGYNFICDAVEACSNDSIISRTKNFIDNNNCDFVVIGWSTWEREDWEYNGKIYTVTASGYDSLPEELHTRYKEFVINSTTQESQCKAENSNFEKILKLHKYLKSKQVPHLFFNCFSFFQHRSYAKDGKKDWGNYFINPYEKTGTYYFWLAQQGYKPSNPKYYHYGVDAHQAWANFLLPKVQNILTHNG